MKFVLWSNKASTGDYCASVVYARYLSDMWQDALAVWLAKPNEQTSYIFDKAQLSLPTVQDELEDEAHVVLVNHNSAGNSIDALDQYVLDTVIDIHPLQLTTKYPISTRTEPVWSTCSIIAEMFVDKVYIPEINYIIVLLAGIISDTDNFSTDISTERDEEAFHWLKEIANIEDLDTFLQDILEKSS